MVNDNPRLQRWRRAALPASVVLNLFLLALIGGHALHHGFGAETRPASFHAALERAERVLPPRDAAAFGATIRQDGPKYAQAAQQLTEARQALAQQIASDPFDKEATARAFANWRASWDHFTEQLSGTLVDALSKVSPEGRRKLVSERRSRPEP